MKSSDTTAKISPALVKAINAIEGVKKGQDNPFFKSKYATLEAVIEAAHEHLAANDLAVMQGPGPMQGNALTVTTRLVHTSGEWIETDFTIPLAKQDPQAAGSAVTYARRYSLMAMLNMPAVDDDGESAMNRITGNKLGNGGRDGGPGPVEAKDFWGCSGPGKSAHAAKKDGTDEAFDRMRGEISVLPTTAALREWIETNQADISTMPASWRSILREECEERGTELGHNPNERKAA